MSYNVLLLDAQGRTCAVACHREGGTYALHGSERAELNVTYNYSPIYDRLWPRARRIKRRRTFALSVLHGLTAAESIPLLRDGLARLDMTTQCADYWQATEGNAGVALAILLGWAEQHPAGCWEVGE